MLSFTCPASDSKRMGVLESDKLPERARDEQLPEDMRRTLVPGPLLDRAAMGSSVLQPELSYASCKPSVSESSAPLCNIWAAALLSIVEASAFTVAVTSGKLCSFAWESAVVPGPPAAMDNWAGDARRSATAAMATATTGTSLPSSTSKNSSSSESPVAPCAASRFFKCGVYLQNEHHIMRIDATRGSRPPHVYSPQHNTRVAQSVRPSGGLTVQRCASVRR
jgi:hypothetical protein